MENEEKIEPQVGEESNMDLQKNETEEKPDAKKIKNLISAVILLSGLFLGSLFIDFSQLVTGSGFSQKNLKKSSIFEANGRTWVAYSEPVISIKVINDSRCEECNVSETLVWMRRIVPTISTEAVEYDSKEGKRLMEKFKIKSVPAFVFSKDVTQTDFYSQASVLFEEKEGDYFLKAKEIGLPIGRYVEIPSITDEDIAKGTEDAKVKVVVYADYLNPYSKMFDKTLEDAMNIYKSQVFFAQKNLPSEMNPQSVNAALASECAYEQGKFSEYSNKLFAAQAEWGNAKNVQKFKDYARTLGISQSQFNKCLDEKKYQEKLIRIKQEADNFSIAEAPMVFVNDKAMTSFTPEELKSLIDAELAK